MDENNYFKLFDQYIGKSKLVPELYKQVKNINNYNNES